LNETKSWITLRRVCIIPPCIRSWKTSTKHGIISITYEQSIGLNNMWFIGKSQLKRVIERCLWFNNMKNQRQKQVKKILGIWGWTIVSTLYYLHVYWKSLFQNQKTLNLWFKSNIVASPMLFIPFQGFGFV
jgi:hypothetical protein